MSNVVVLPVETTLDIMPDRVLEAAIDKLESVVIMGFTKDGEEYFASSVADMRDVLWHLERAKFKLLNLVE